MKSIIIVGSLLLLFPNIFNSKERKAFSNSHRLDIARSEFHADSISDSVYVSAGGNFYKRNSIHHFFYGKKNRDLWSEKIKVKVLHIDTLYGGLHSVEIGGSMQTIGLDLLSNKGNIYDLRSVNKDQSKALPKWLRITYARFMFRDGTAALNPYASLIIPKLAEAAGILYSSPQLVFVPYDPKMKKDYRYVMAGRMAIIEENAGKSWKGDKKFDYALKFYDTDEMLVESREKNIPIDTLLYLRCRLFDMLINDWDRHEGQWEWALIKDSNKLQIKPVPKDRDMAFYNFKGGLLSSLTLLLNNKFQSFTKEIENVEALSKNSMPLDRILLKDVDSSIFINIASELQKQLSDSIIMKAVKNYPPEIYKMVGREHRDILILRRNDLTHAAKEFHKVLNQ